MTRFLPILTLILSLGVAAQAADPVRNGDFSTRAPSGKPTVWSEQSWGPPTGEITLDDQISGAAAPALRLHNTRADQQTFLVQPVTLESQCEYTLSYMIRGNAILGDKPFCGGAVYLMDNGNPLFSIGIGLYRHATGTFDWKRVEHTFKTGRLQSPTLSLVLSLRSVNGEVWYDDVRLTRKEKPRAAEAQLSLYPVDYQRDTYSLCAGFPAPLLLRATLAEKLAPGAKLRLILELPEGVRVPAAGALLPERDVNGDLVFRRDVITSEPVMRDQRPYRRWSVTLSDGFSSKLGPQQAWENYTRVYLEGSGEPRAAGNCYWRLATDGRTFPEKRFQLTILPPLATGGKACERFQLCLARLWHMNTAEGIADRYLAFWGALQRKPWISDPYYFHAFPEAERAKVLGKFQYVTHLASSSSMPWMSSLYNAVAENRFPGKFPQSVKADGSKVPVSVSPWYLIEDPENLIWGTLFDEYADSIRRKPYVRAIAIDFEPGAFTHCFSPESRERFARFAKLSATPDTATILARYRAEWLQFRIEQHRRILQRLSQAIRSKLPDMQFWLISDPLQTGGQRVAEWCGVDVQASDPDIDLHQDMPYFCGLPFFETMKLNINELAKPCFPFIDPTEDMEMYYKRYTPQTVLQNIVTVAALGGYGIGFWPNDVFDGSYLPWIQKAYHAIAEVESAYAAAPQGNTLRAACRNVMHFDARSAEGKATRIAIPQLDRTLRTLHHRQPGRDVITVFNFSPRSSAIVELALPDASAAAFHAVELIGGKRLSDGGETLSGDAVRRGFLVELPPNGTAILLLSEKPHQLAAAGTIDQQSVQAELDRQLRQYASGSKIKTVRQDGAATYWGLLPESDDAVLFLEQGENRIGVAALGGGEIVSHQFGKDDALHHLGRGFLNRFTFNSPDQPPESCRFELTGIGIADGNPALTMQCTVPDFANASAQKNPLTGLRITAETALLEQGGKIRVRYRFANPTDQEMKFSFKINNFPKVGGRFAGTAPLTGLTRISSGALSFTPGVPTGERLCLTAPDAAPELRSQLIYGRMKITPVEPPKNISIRGGRELCDTLHIVPDARCAGFYSWANTVEGYTVEPVSAMLTLPPGKELAWSCEYRMERRR